MPSRSCSWRAGLLLGLLATSPAIAEESIAETPIAEKPLQVDPKPDEEGDRAASATVSPKPRQGACGCARPRLLRDGKEVVLSEHHALAAWLEGEGRARLETFERDGDEGMRTVAPPLAETAFDLSAFEGAVPSRARLVKLYATAPDDAPFFVGVLRPPSKTAGDVVRARIHLGGARGEPPEPGAPVLLAALHLGPLEQRDSPGCGAYATHRLVFGTPEGGREPAGFLATFRPTEGPARTALVDVRHARTFGLGRVTPCDHGLPLEAGEAGELVVRTVSRDFSVGPAWRYVLTGAVDAGQPAPLEVPEHADLDSVENPFAPGYRTPFERLLSDDTDHAVLGAMAALVVGAGVLASLLWGGRRRRRRQMLDVKCPACEKPLALDLGDPETDGMFCPACGKSSVFVTFEPDGTPRARVMKLG